MTMRTKTDKRQIEYVSTGKLTPYARNSRTHSPQQVKQIAASIKEFGFTNPVLIDESNSIIAGHGRVMAAEHLQLTEVPCIRLEYLTETQKKAYVIADNKLALNAGWDEEMLNIELTDLHDASFDLQIIGFDASELSNILGYDSKNESSNSEENPYSQKIATPAYEPNNEKPSLIDLYELSKYQELLNAIENSSCEKSEKQFLMYSASRHIVFNYAKIADYYAHADKQMQELMENSALVIIDYNKAIEQGLVKLSKDIDELFSASTNEE